MSKKKRNKKYRPQAEQPVVHKFVAEEEDVKQSKKRNKRRLIIFGISVLLLALILELLL